MTKSIMAFSGIRPLRGGEHRKNPDGSRSTELTLTDPIDGVWTAYPSLWVVNNKIVELKAPEAQRAVKAYEKRTGKKFPRFKNQETAQDFVIPRSNRGGASSIPLEK